MNYTAFVNLQLNDRPERCDFDIFYEKKMEFLQISFFSAGVGGCYDEMCSTGLIVIGVSKSLSELRSALANRLQLCIE